MTIDTIIVQAGGLGTRLGHLTKNKSKAMVSVNNAPILFHLFQKFPHKKFIIIGDYKVEALSDYLDCFAPVDFVLIRSKEKGNLSGLSEAMTYLPKRSGFMVIWSDLILDHSFSLEQVETLATGGEEACYVGVSDVFPCSWRFLAEQGTMEKRASEGKNGVAGCFLFQGKECLQDLPTAGSFTQYLKESGMKLGCFSLKDSEELGSIEAIERVDKSNENRCRPYNQMEFLEDRVIKRGLTAEAKDLIEREIVWFDAVKRLGFRGVPEVLSLEPLTTRRIMGDNLFLVPVAEEEKKRVLFRLVNQLKDLHQMETSPPNYFDMMTEYYGKTMKRLGSIGSCIPFAHEGQIEINGLLCENVLVNSQVFREKVQKMIESTGDASFGLLHGDCTFTNTLVDQNKEIYFIDPRGYFGKTALVGDVYYDWAKVYYSIEGKFDQFNIKNFRLDIEETGVTFEIGASGWEEYTSYFLSLIPQCDQGRLELIHGIIWLSLASHCWEDFDSMCLAFYHGLWLVQRCMQEE